MSALKGVPLEKETPSRRWKVQTVASSLCSQLAARAEAGLLLSSLVRMRSAVQIRPAAPKILENFGFRGFFVVKSCFAVWPKISDPHRDPHAETAGKDERAPDGKICFPARFFIAFFSLILYDLPQDGAHGLGSLVLLLPRGVGVGAQGKPGVVVPQHGGHSFHVHAIL